MLKKTEESSPQTHDVVIIGYGNTLRCDDGAGPAVVHRLRRTLKNQSVKLIESHQLLPEHSQDLVGAKLVIFIDASVNVPHGDVTFSPIEPGGAYAMTLGHHLGPETLLSWVTGLFGENVPRAFLYSIGAEKLEHGEVLSPQVQQAVMKASLLIQRRVRSFLGSRIAQQSLLHTEVTRA